ncbi:MAG: ATP-dependent DNA helicase [Clostridia bacterium]|nr:ATP-dependent DNA helicase [Clostridia bacterium]
MRYDREKNIINIDCKEFVSIARRRISATVPFDQDEPRSASYELLAMHGLRGERPRCLTLSFTTGEHAFSLTSAADAELDGELWFAKSVSSSPKKPNRETVAQIRAEAFVTAYIILKSEGASAIPVLNFAYINPNTAEVHTTKEHPSEKSLESFFERCRTAIAEYARPEVERVTERLPSMKAAKFPYESVREGQSEFIRSVYKNIARGTSLCASAPTGTGKTVSAIFPAIRALGDGRCDKVFYLTPKTTTQAAAGDCINLFAENGVKIRSVMLSAKDRICIGSRACRIDRASCQNSKCNKLAEATLELYSEGKSVVTSDDIAHLARRFSVCPYELSLSYSELCDIVICDFNYLFDPRVYIRRFFDTGGSFVFLVDEAHNLVDRAREMYSAELSSLDISDMLASELVGEHSPLGKALSDFERGFRSLVSLYLKDELRTDEHGVPHGATHMKEPPGELYTLAGELLTDAEASLLGAYSDKTEERTQKINLYRAFYYKISAFNEALARFDDGYELFMFCDGDEVRMKLYCIDTGRIIAERVSLGRCAVFFSATLEPIEYFSSLLGCERASEKLMLSSPFASEQVSVSIMDKVSTRYSERQDTLTAVARIIAATVSAKRGNYMIFSPSFAYSDALSEVFRRAYPKISVLTQRKDMSTREKREFLEKFKKKSSSYLIGFCVMGGIFSEGVDLAGDSLIGAVVVGIGMPSLSYEREAISAYFDEKCESGKQFAYIYPGLNRVLQAAGRVIRRDEDRGVIVLIDDRFADPLYKKSLPSFWSSVRFVEDAKALRARLDDFWRDVDEEKAALKE